VYNIIYDPVPLSSLNTTRHIPSSPYPVLDHVTQQPTIYPTMSTRWCERCPTNNTPRGHTYISRCAYIHIIVHGPNVTRVRCWGSKGARRPATWFSVINVRWSSSIYIYIYIHIYTHHRPLLTINMTHALTHTHTYVYIYIYTRSIEMGLRVLTSPLPLSTHIKPLFRHSTPYGPQAQGVF